MYESAWRYIYLHSQNREREKVTLFLADVKKLQRDCAESGNELKRMFNEKTAHNANKYAKEQKQLQKRHGNEVSDFYKISHFLERILMEHIEIKNSLDSKL